MARPGPKPTPTSVLKERGSWLAKLRGDEPEPPGDEGEMPEGLGVGGSEAWDAIRTALGYLTHPLVKYGLVLEHGCEKTHNDYFRHELGALGIPPQAFGWASVQIDGGIERVLRKIEDWFASRIAEGNAAVYEQAGPESLRVGLLDAGPISETASESLAIFPRDI